MNPDTLLKDALTEWADEATVPADLADRVLRRRRRRRTVAVPLAVAAALAACALTVPAVDVVRGHHAAGPAALRTSDVRAHPHESPPRHLVAAGDVAVSAYRVVSRVTRQADHATRTSYDWYLYDPGTHRYRKTSWGWLDVAPGMKRAAVLERTLPAHRVGILDLATGRVTQWIPLDHGAGGVHWSPDGRRLAVTTYDGDPDVAATDGGRDASKALPHRTGYYLIDPAAGSVRYHRVGARFEGRGGIDGRGDVGWSQDSTRLYATAPGGHTLERWYDLRGHPAARPPYEGNPDTDAGPSPDGRYYTVGDGATAAVKRVGTGRTVNPWSDGEMLAWTDDDRLVRWQQCRHADCGGRDAERLVLTDVTGRRSVPLTGYRSRSGTTGDWSPVITRG